MKDTFYVTTAIDYVNALPHLGTAYEKVGADVLVRYRRLTGKKTFFLMGVDEHSLNVEKEARRLGLPPQEYCDDLEKKFRAIWEHLNISYDHFIRTTDEDHVKTVQEIFRIIYEKGEIYKGFYEGWYCVSCETFLQEKELSDGLCPFHRSEPQWIREENYFFALSRYTSKLREHILKNPDFVRPEIRRNEILNVIEQGLTDISVSRSSVGWGIPLSFDASHVVYVWFDALINYVSGAGYPHDPGRFENTWPADVHVIGKDITRFHCIIWPAMLMAAGIELPRSVFGHGFLYLRGEKMSKTAGTLVNPMEAAEKFGVDALRYYLMREIPFHKDGDFTWDGFRGRYDSDLANDMGNLLNRVVSMMDRYNGGIIPDPGAEAEEDRILWTKSEEVWRGMKSCMDDLDFSRALALLWEFVQAGNRYVEKTAPWNLNKDPGTKDRLLEVLGTMAESLRRIACLVAPFMPETADNILLQLGMEEKVAPGSLSEASFFTPVLSGKKVSKQNPLFPRKD